MKENEQKMKSRGEKKIWKDIKKESNEFKKIPSTQIGQRLIFDEALRVFDEVRDWIKAGSSTVYKKKLQKFFIEDDILLEKITQTYLFMAGSIYREFENNVCHKVRHKNISVLEKNILIGLEFEEIWKFVEVLINSSDYFSTDSVNSINNYKIKTSVRYTCSLSNTILREIANESVKAFFPLPMKQKPIDWSVDNKNVVGGYIDFQYGMIRSNFKIKDYSLYSKNIFKSLNFIQSTAWKINEDLVNIIDNDLKKPKKEDFIKNDFPNELFKLSKFEINLKEEHDLTKEEVSELKDTRIRFNESAVFYNSDLKDFQTATGKYRSVKMAVDIAKSYIGDTIYFPHNYDFRGRVYPIPVLLSPQGGDAVKSMLLFANVESPTARGIEWSFAYLTSLYGDDKIPFKERVKKGKQLLEVDYKTADEPYQFLSTQLELKKWVKDKNYKINIAVHLDACCSGSQFISSITGDRNGCISTNVIPSYDVNGNFERRDVYEMVAKISIDLINKKIKILDNLKEKDVCKLFKKLLEKNGRKICKKPTMVKNYGGTSMGRADIIEDELKGLKVDREHRTKKNIYKLAKIVGDAILSVLEGAKEFEKYIHKMNNIIAKDGNPVKWVTADGFIVIHTKNKELKSKQVSILLPSSRKRTTILKKVYSEDIDSSKMRSSISPNFTHSLDAEFLRRVALHIDIIEITSASFIHDSFGCTPNNVDSLLEVLKEEFRLLVKRNPLTLLDVQLRRQVKKTPKNTKMLSKIVIPNLRGFDLKRGDLDVVLNSEWFFS